MKLFMTYSANLSLISKYNRNIYEVESGKILYFLNYPESYIAYYNNGNLYFKNNDFDKAIEQYKIALSMNHPMNERDCSIRINLALAMLNTFDLENLTTQKIQDILNVLDEADQVLMEVGCAKTLENGHSEDAITIRNEIEDLRQRLKDAKPSASEPQKEEKEPDEPDKIQTDKEKEEQLKELQEKSNSKRQSENSNSKIDFENYSNRNVW